jgi:hypothetical protein
VKSRSKARRTLQEARILLAAGMADGAASRAYYALYQHVVARLQERGRTPASFGPVDPRNPASWSHGIVLRGARAAGLLPVDASTIRSAWEFRILADYGAASVDPGPLAGIMRDAWTIVGDPEIEP